MNNWKYWVAALFMAFSVSASALVHTTAGNDADYLAELSAAAPADLDPQVLDMALRRALLRQWSQSASWLLAHGANVNARNWMGRTALSVLVEGLETPRMGLSAERVRQVPQWEGLVIPRMRLSAQEQACFDLLLPKLADIDAKDVAGETALLIAAEQQRFDVVILLSKQGADINAIGMLGETALKRAPLHWVAALVQAGARLGPLGSARNTYLHYLMETKRGAELLAYVRTALDAGAQDARNAVGEWATDLGAEQTPLGVMNGKYDEYVAHLHAARELIKATRPTVPPSR